MGDFGVGGYWGSAKVGVCAYVGEEIVQAAWCGVYSCVGGVDGDAFLGEAEEGLLLSVAQSQGL